MVVFPTRHSFWHFDLGVGTGAFVFLEEHVPPEQHPPFLAGGFSTAGTGAGAGACFALLEHLPPEQHPPLFLTSGFCSGTDTGISILSVDLDLLALALLEHVPPEQHPPPFLLKFLLLDFAMAMDTYRTLPAAGCKASMNDWLLADRLVSLGSMWSMKKNRLND